MHVVSNTGTVARVVELPFVTFRGRKLFIQILPTDGLDKYADDAGALVGLITYHEANPTPPTVREPGHSLAQRAQQTLGVDSSQDDQDDDPTPHSC